jgi:hypothetical protein
LENHLKINDFLSSFLGPAQVLPSIINSQQVFNWEEFGMKSIPEPEWIGENGFWININELKKYHEKYNIQKKDYLIIAITLHLKDLNEGLCQFWDEQGNCIQKWTHIESIDSPLSASEKWFLLGYDVCDSGYISGLSNCGCIKEDGTVEDREKQWGIHLNDYHLFNSIEKSFEFREFSNNRVKEHAPFFVTGIWIFK